MRNSDWQVKSVQGVVKGNIACAKVLRKNKLGLL